MNRLLEKVATIKKLEYLSLDSDFKKQSETAIYIYIYI